MKYQAGDFIYKVKELSIVPTKDDGIIICNTIFRHPEDYVNSMIFLEKHEAVELAKALIDYISVGIYKGN